MFYESYNPADYSWITLLGVSVNPDRALQIGPLTLNFYGMIIAFGLALAVVYSL